MIGLPRGLVRGARISALGIYVPERVVTNDELSQTLDTSDEWIVTRTGIRERRICAPGEATSDVAVAAVNDLLAQNGHRAEDIELVISTSLVPDHVFPATASVIAERVGAVNAGAFDVQSGCTGFVYGLACATAFVAAGLYDKVLVDRGRVAQQGTRLERPRHLRALRRRRRRGPRRAERQRFDLRVRPRQRRHRRAVPQHAGRAVRACRPATRRSTHASTSCR